MTTHLTQTEKQEIYCCATEDNMSYAELATAYEVSEDEIEQIVLSFITQRGD